MSEQETQETSGLNPRRSRLPKPEPRDFKREFEQYLADNALYNAEYAALMATARQMIFEREQAGFIGSAFLAGGPCYERPNLLYRLRKQSTQ